MNQNSIIELLKKVRIFQELDNSALDLLQQKMRRHSYQPEEILCREGELGNQMFVIESGEISVLKMGDDGKLIEVATLPAGEIAGEMSLFGPSSRSATLKARGETIVWILDFSSFQNLLEQHGAIAKGLLACLSQHLRRETSVVAKLLSRDLDHRFKVAFFDSKSYTESAFKSQNRLNYALHFFESRLTLETVAMAAGFKVVCVFVNDNLNTKVIESLSGLGVEMIALRCAGFNNVDLAACERCGITVARVPAYSPYAVAEHALALMMTLNRRTHRANNRVREGNFSLHGLVGFDMHGKTAGIIGTGKIGKCLTSILAGCGCRLLGYDMYQDNQLVERYGLRYVELDMIYAESDIISLHAPLTPQTRHLINAEAIAKMKRGVMLINTSRGALVDTPALLEGLKSGQIGYAGLDVYEEESEFFFEDLSDRVITDDILARLMTFNNVIVTGHQGFLTQEALNNIASITFDNIREYEAGKRGKELNNFVGVPA